MESHALPESASALIDQRIANLADWRGETLARVRALVHAAIPGIVEEWKWRGTPTWCSDGILCTGETYKNVVKLTFAHGAALPDPAGLFNASLEGNVRRAIDLHEHDTIDEAAFVQLLRAAADRNSAARAKSAPRKRAAAPSAKRAPAHPSPSPP